MPLLPADSGGCLAPNQSEVWNSWYETHQRRSRWCFAPPRIILHAVEWYGRAKRHESWVGRRDSADWRKRWRETDDRHGLRTPCRCAHQGQPAHRLHDEPNLRGGGEEMREAVGERTPITMEPGANAERAIRRGLGPIIEAISRRFLKQRRPQAQLHP